jgi:hypothetical protein
MPAYVEDVVADVPRGQAVSLAGSETNTNCVLAAVTLGTRAAEEVLEERGGNAGST